MQPTPRHRAYAFIDSQNLNLGVQKDLFWPGGNRRYSGWKLDFGKFRRFLKDKYRVEKAFLFIGYVESQEPLYEYLRHCGFEVIIKTTTTFKNSAGEEVVKGNVDTDLVLYAAAKEIDHFDQAILVSGDGDFLSLCDYLFEAGKLGRILIPNKLGYSQLLNKYATHLDFVSPNRHKLVERPKK